MIRRRVICNIGPLSKYDDGEPNYLERLRESFRKSTPLRVMIDEEKVNAYKANFGFCQIVTSELEMDPVEIMEKYHQLSRIEDQFRVMKSDLETRPIYVRKPEHIEAHLTICLVALVMLRMIQHRICKSDLIANANPNRLWNMGLSAERIQAALNKWRVDVLPNGLYRFCDTDDPDLKLIQKKGTFTQISIGIFLVDF